MNKINHILIITGGVQQPEFLQECCEQELFDYVIAVDGALELVDRLALPIHCLVGDFDTVSEGLLKKYKGKEKLYVEQHIPEKDETDTELALRIAMEKNAADITIVGATGGRLDHFLGNLHILLQPLRRNIPCFLLDPWNRIRLVEEYCAFSEEDAFGTYISFLPFTDEVQDVSLIGFKYPLDHACLKKGNTLGVSNERIASRAEVRLGKGILICVESQDMKDKDAVRQGKRDSALAMLRRNEVADAEKTGSDQ